MTILPFSGDLTNYPLFIKLFRLKFDGLEMTNAEKLQHLKTCLRDEPLQIIGNLEITDANNTLAVQTLKEKYDKLVRVISILYHKINVLRHADNEPASLRAVYYELEGLFTALNAHGQEINAIPSLQDQILAKYPLFITQQVCG